MAWDDEEISEAATMNRFDFVEKYPLAARHRGRPRGCRQSEAVKAKISEAQRGEKNSMAGRRQSRRTRQLQSEAASRHWRLRREVIAPGSGGTD
jgi:hypothetical protein